VKAIVRRGVVLFQGARDQRSPEGKGGRAGGGEKEKRGGELLFSLLTKGKKKHGGSLLRLWESPEGNTCPGSSIREGKRGEREGREEKNFPFHPKACGWGTILQSQQRKNRKRGGGEWFFFAIPWGRSISVRPKNYLRVR